MEQAGPGSYRDKNRRLATTRGNGSHRLNSLFISSCQASGAEILNPKIEIRMIHQGDARLHELLFGFRI